MVCASVDGLQWNFNRGMNVIDRGGMDMSPDLICIIHE